MISYEPFWKTMKEKSLTSYALTKKMNVKETTLYRIRKGRPMTTTTLDDLCRILDCEVQDVICYLPDDTTPHLRSNVSPHPGGELSNSRRK